MATTPYIGAKISLLSKIEIRYEGTLASIDTEQSTVTLQNVTSFGTEGRRKDGPQIPPKPEQFATIIFRSSDIQDLSLCNPSAESTDDFEDPAVVSATTAPLQLPAVTQISHEDAWPRQHSPIVTPHGYEHMNNQSTSRGRGRGRGNGSRNRGNGRNAHPRRRGNGRRGSGGSQKRTQPVRVGTDFDFESMNDRFDKEAELAKLASKVSLDDDDAENDALSDAQTVPTPDTGSTPAYNPGSFFDNLSSNVKDRQSGRSRIDGRQQRQLNQQTFGDSGWSHQYHYNRGRGRNYRGRGRGRGRVHHARVQHQ